MTTTDGEIALAMILDWSTRMVKLHHRTMFGFFGLARGAPGAGICAAVRLSAMIRAMTYQESVILIKELMAAKSKDDLQIQLGNAVDKVDATFFMVVNDVAAKLRKQGKADAAKHLTDIGDSLARLRFMI